ncbi:MAG TPA: hypothetical protein VFS43_21650 [Polyangiaceae bacterium]|nr:hypothetical protein [Polyangiaceae bacterium]
MTLRGLLALRLALLAAGWSLAALGARVGSWATLAAGLALCAGGDAIAWRVNRSRPPEPEGEAPLAWAAEG